MSRAATSPARDGEGSEPLLQVRDLSVEYQGADQEPFLALDGVSFDLAAGEALGVLGESGGGKSTLALAILGLLPPAGRVAGGSMHFRGRRLDRLEEPWLENIRGAQIALIFQEPNLALHPLRRVREQIVEVIRAHHRWPRKRCRERSAALLAEVGFTADGGPADGGPADSGVARAYPHQLSGGQRQRVVIAQALACRPALLIADEPTAALDMTTQARVLALIKDLNQRRAVALLTISHDPEVLGAVADRLLVIYAGRVVEAGPAEQVLGAPLHPYTEALLGCLPPLPGQGDAGTDRRLPVIAGSAPTSRALPSGCCFAPRCRHQIPACDRQQPAWRTPRPGHAVRCILYD